MEEDIPGDARLLTYAELGELLGIEPESAKRRAVRHGWRRVPGNEGRTLVAVPGTAIPESPSVLRTPPTPSESRPGGTTRDEGGNVRQDIPGDTPGCPGDAVHALSMASAALAELQAAMLAAERRRAEAEERAGRVEARADAAQALADRRGEELAELRERVGRVEGEAAALREQGRAQHERDGVHLRDAETAQEALKAELAEWTAGGPLARALRAFLYRRGRP